jgi:two-component system, NarL family, nitrate/nitrite response regulator NarL
VLLADDHPAVVDALRRLLSVDCDVVGVIADGRAVADAATRLQPVVLVLDLNLPHVSGLEICRRMTQSGLAIPVIMITANADDYIRDEALAAGAKDFFDKSASRELPQAVRRLWAESS